MLKRRAPFRVVLVPLDVEIREELFEQQHQVCDELICGRHVRGHHRLVRQERVVRLRSYRIVADGDGHHRHVAGLRQCRSRPAR